MNSIMHVYTGIDVPGLRVGGMLEFQLKCLLHEGNAILLSRKCTFLVLDVYSPRDSI